MRIYRNVPLSGTAPIVNAINWFGQNLVATNSQRSQTIFSNAVATVWQPPGYAGQPLSGVTIAGPARTILALLGQTLGPASALDAIRLQQPNSLPGPYTNTGLVLFSKTFFAGVLRTDQVILSSTNIFSGLFADLTQASGVASAIRWVICAGDQSSVGDVLPKIWLPY